MYNKKEDLLGFMSLHYACKHYNKGCKWNDDFLFFTTNTMAIIAQVNEAMLLYGYIREIGFVIDDAS